MKKILALIIGLLVTLCLFACAGEGTGEVTDTADTTDVLDTTEAVMTTIPDDETDESITKVDYLTSVDEEVNGFSVKGQKYYYEYNDEDFLIFDVENLTEKVQTVKFSVTFYDENGNEVEKGTETFPDFPVEGVHSFIFRTSEKFAGFTYELSAKEYDKEPVYKNVNFTINNIRRVDITDPITGEKVPSLCADFSSYITEKDVISYGSCMNNIVIFDTDGNVQSLSTMHDSFGMGSAEKTVFLRVIPEDFDVSFEELNAKVIFSDVTYKYKDEDAPYDVDEDDEAIRQDDVIKKYDAEKVFDNGFSIKEKKYTLDGKDVLLMYVENPTDISYAVTISVSYFDESGTMMKKQVQSYDWFCGDYQKYFLFRPGKTFADYTCEVEFVKVEDVPRLLTNTTNLYNSASIISENEELIWIPVPMIMTTLTENKSDSDMEYIYSAVIFDDKGELYDITKTGMPAVIRADTKKEVATNLYYLSDELSQYAITIDDVAEKFDGKAKAIFIVMDVEILENYDEIYG